MHVARTFPIRLKQCKATRAMPLHFYFQRRGRLIVGNIAISESDSLSKSVGAAEATESRRTNGSGAAIDTDDKAAAAAIDTDDDAAAIDTAEDAAAWPIDTDDATAIDSTGDDAAAIDACTAGPLAVALAGSCESSKFKRSTCCESIGAA